MTKVFQFNLECEKKYSGVSLDIRTLSDIENFDHFHDINDEQSDLKLNNVRSCAYFLVRFFRQSFCTEFPVVISLFLASNYCDTYNNVVAILKLDANQQLCVVHIKTHAHPFVLPHDENRFQFGEGFIRSYTTRFRLSIFNIYSLGKLAVEDGLQDKFSN